MAASLLSHTASMQSSSQLLSSRQQASSSRSCVQPAAIMFRPGVRFNTQRPADVRRAAQGNPQNAGGFRVGWGSPAGQWPMGGPQTMRTLDDIIKEFERANAGYGGFEQRRRPSSPQQQSPTPSWQARPSRPEQQSATPSWQTQAQDPAVRTLAVDVEEDDQGYTLIADIPGLSRGDIKVKVDKDRFMIISGDRTRKGDSESAGTRDSRRRQNERFFGKFSRKFKLPGDADVECVTARTEGGVLYVSIRRTAEPRNRVTNVPIF